MNARNGSQPISRSGGALLSIVIGLILISLMGASMAGLLYRSGHGHAQAYDVVRARYLAESGISFARTPGQLKKLAAAKAPVTIKMGPREQFAVEVSQSNNLYRVESIGSTGIDSNRKTHQRITRSKLRDLDWDPDISPPAVEGSPVASVTDDFDAGDLSNWQVTKSTSGYTGFERTEFSGADGLIKTDMRAENFMAADPQDGDHYVGHQNLFFDHRSILEEAWKANSYQISYEAQVKMLWYTYRRYGAQGLAVLLKSKDKRLSKGKSEGYYVSLMRYYSDDEKGEYSDTVSYDYDGIPNAIKPPGLARHRLLVVWNQWNSGKKREWLAYKDLGSYAGLPGEDAMDWVMDYNDGSSGQGFKDYATIAVRVIEAAGDTKYRYLQVLRADPKTKVTRRANTVGEDINSNRKAYPPQREGGVFPKWSPLDFNNWDPDNDYFTLQATRSDDPLEKITWDGVNTNGHAKIIILPDNGTIRSEDHQTDKGKKWDDKRYEIGLHATGNFNNSLDNEMFFDEFSIRFFMNKSFGTEASSVQF